MDSVDDIPSTWETKDVETVTVNPHTGEVVEQVSSSGAGPQVQQVRGTVTRRPCPNCTEDDAEMIYEAPMGVIVCDYCGYSLTPMLQDQPE